MSAPPKIYGWLNTPLSTARHYGGCKFNGHGYKVDYLDPDQPLVRVDVLQAELKEKRMKVKAARLDNAGKQGALI